MSTSEEPEKKKIRVNDDGNDNDSEKVRELPRGWEKRMSRSNSSSRQFPFCQAFNFILSTSERCVAS